MPNKHVVLITSGQPSLNPRLVKEADALCDAGYSITVIYAYWNDWGTEIDKELLAGKRWKAIRAGGSPNQNKLVYFISRAIYKSAQRSAKIGQLYLSKDIAIARSSYYLTREAKKHQADLYIGHNLGALPATVKAAKKYGKPCGFDAEDFHRHEMSDDVDDPDVKLKSAVEDKYLPQVNYFTASSAPIAEAYKKLYSFLNPVTIRNVFPKADIGTQQISTDDTKPLKLFWLSQVIGFQRGLENLIEGLATMTGKFELHLLGYSNPDFKKKIEAANIKVYLYAPISPEELTRFASQFDIGLALEPGFSINNNLALSNKIFTYMQAGLAIIASNTTAQQNLFNDYPAIGKSFAKSDQRALLDVLNYYDEHRDELIAARKASLAAAQTDLNWETEREKFLSLVNSTIGD